MIGSALVARYAGRAHAASAVRMPNSRLRCETVKYLAPNNPIEARIRSSVRQIRKNPAVVRASHCGSFIRSVIGDRDEGGSMADSRRAIRHSKGAQQQRVECTER